MRTKPQIYIGKNKLTCDASLAETKRSKQVDIEVDDQTLCQQPICLRGKKINSLSYYQMVFGCPTSSPFHVESRPNPGHLGSVELYTIGALFAGVVGFTLCLVFIWRCKQIINRQHTEEAERSNSG